MKILIITHYFPPLSCIASFRPYSWYKYWSGMGHDVTVLTTKKNKNGNNLNLDYSGLGAIEEIPNKSYQFLSKINTKNLNSGINGKNKCQNFKKNKNFILNFMNNRGIVSWDARFPNIHDCWYKDAYKAVSSRKWDLAVSTFAPYVAHLIAYRLKTGGNTKFWIADYRDLWTQSHMFKGLFPFSMLEEYWERKINNAADIVTTVSEPLAIQIREKYKLNNVRVIENGFDSDDLKNIPEEPYWSDGKIRLVYTGTIYEAKRDPSPLFEAVMRIAESGFANLLDNFEIIFAGVAGNLYQLVNKYNVQKWVKYYGLVKREDALRMQRDANGLIFLEFDGASGILTGKLFEYLFSGTIILGIGISGQEGSPGKIIEDAEAGLALGKDADKIMETLISIIDGKINRKVAPKIEILQNYTREYQAKRMLKLMDIAISGEAALKKSESVK